MTLLALALTALLGAVAADAAPRRAGDMVFAQEAQVSGLDMHFSSAISSRNIAMHLYECLLTRDDSNAPIAELAEK
jgi:peptide/nickel transport system substrate-binding protein